MRSSAALACREDTDRSASAFAKRADEMGADSADMFPLFGVRIEVTEMDVEQRWEEEHELMFREDEKVLSWLEDQDSVKSRDGKRGVGRAVEKAGAWWKKVWESNKAAAGTGGFM